jgi:uncharacterized protein (DUF433 family)
VFQCFSKRRKKIGAQRDPFSLTDPPNAGRALANFENHGVAETGIAGGKHRAAGNRTTSSSSLLATHLKRTTLPLLTTDNYRQRITIEPGKRGGKPCIRHMRITVYDILGWLAAGMSNPEILTDYPDLTIEDIQAALAFAADREHHLVAASA